jgi:hypothetical protein
MYNNSHFDIKLVPAFFDAKVIICITLREMPGEGLTHVRDFKI